MNTSLLFPLTLIVIEIAFAVVFLLHDRNRITRTFTVLVFFHVIWIISHGLLHSLIPTETLPLLLCFFESYPIESLAHYLVICNYVTLGIVSVSFFYLSLTYGTKKRPSLFLLLGLIISQFACFFLYLSNSIIEKTFFSENLQVWQWHYGSLWFIFDFMVLFFLGFGSYISWRKSTKVKKEKNKTQFLFWSLLLAIILFVIFDIGLPQTGYFALNWTSPLIGIGWIIILAYIIAKDKKIFIETFFKQTFFLAVSLVLFINVIILGLTQDLREVVEVISKSFVFIAFVSVGRLLVLNISKESRRKKNVEYLNKQLQELNEDLEGKIIERTKELTETKIHSEAILENFTLGIIEYDESFTILRINKAAEQFLGINRQKVINKTIKPKDSQNQTLVSFTAVLYPSLSEDGHKTNLKEEFEQNISKNEIVITYPEKRELQIITIPLKGLYSAETPRFIKLIRDVTHENMVDRSKSEFIKIAAHQLRTPLSGTKWALRAILDKDLGNISKEQEEILQKTYIANKSLIDIVNNFLDVTKFEENFGYQKQENDIIETIKEAILSSTLLAKEKNLKITLKEIGPEIPLFSFDKIKILLVLKNIICNAINYTLDQKEISIIVKKEDDSLFITIIDSGMGIPEKEQGKIFTKFYRTKKAQEIAPNQSGLGLYIAKEVVEKHKGDILIESKEGKGVSVTIRLPLKQ